ncbi:50S ribosomal protein L25/general stress protein Ctc [Wolbachia endosymbiont of Pentidionis agamae]|uniref:50S ribosomal protein L25/general stress protein Ctc n=1 Tax=Wolbachia endosymbiont of Pentidionis agamae TaxID=3110435 RepID=UPI002FD58F17
MVQQEIVNVNAEIRNVQGSKAMLSLRASGLIPAVIYGKGRESIKLTLFNKEFTKEYKSGSLSTHLVELDISGKKEYAVVRDIQLHVVKDTVQHVDFQFVNKDSEIKVNVPLSFVNENQAPGIKLGGVLNILHRFVPIRCFPNNIPQYIEVDLSGKAIGQSIHIDDVKLPENVKLASREENFTVVTISVVSDDNEGVEKEAE